MAPYRAWTAKAVILAILVLTGLSGCADAERAFEQTSVPDSGHLSTADATVHASTSHEAPAMEAMPARSNDQIALYRPGTGQYQKTDDTATASGPTLADADRSINLSFKNAPLSDVVHAVLSEALGLDYTVEGNLSQPVTIQLQTTAAQSLDQIDALLSQNGMAMVWDGRSFHIVPTADALKSNYPGATSSRLRAVALKNIGTDEMVSLLQPFLRPGNLVKADKTRNLLVLAGSPRELETLTDTIASFDVSWIKAFSFGLVPVQDADPTDVVKDMEHAFNGENGRLDNGVKIVALNRMDAVMIVAPDRGTLDEMTAWVKRLDRTKTGNQSRIHVYGVQNMPADHLAQIVIAALGGKIDTQRQQQTNPIAPGLAQTVTTTGAYTGATSSSSSSMSSAALTGATASAPEAPAVYDAGRIRIIADNDRQELVIVSSPDEYERITTLLHRLDAPPRQVLVEVTIAEVNLSDDLSYGLEWFLNNHFPHATGTATLDLGKAGISALTPGFSFALTADTNNAQAILNLLASKSKLTILATPHIFVANRRTADIQVGDQVPILTKQVTVVGSTSSTDTVNSIDYHDTGVILKVTPNISTSNVVQIDVAQEVSQVQDALTTDTLDSPTFSRRAIESSIVVPSGDTIFLGGLIQNNDNNAKSGIPLLKDLPGVGPLFSTTSKSKSRTELVVLLRPVVVDDFSQIGAMISELREKLTLLKED